MNKLKLVIGILTAALLLAGCAAPPPPVEVETAPPTLHEIMQGFARDLNTSGGIAAVGIGESKSSYLALNHAKKNGRIELVRRLETKIAALRLAFTEETGSAGDPAITEWFRHTEEIIIRHIQEINPIEPQQENIEGTIRIFVLIELDPQELLNGLAANQTLYTRLRATRAYTDIDRDIAVYRAHEPLEQ